MKSNRNKIQEKYRRIMKEKRVEEGKKNYHITTMLAISFIVLIIVLDRYIKWF